jgi:hypothetical protein
VDVTISTAGGEGSLVIPISFFFWAYVAAYVVHILDESMLGEGFVGMVRRNFWPEYEWKHFFGFNTMLMSLIIFSIVVYEIWGGAWIIFPLVFVFQMFTNGLWHLGATIITRRYSPGLLTSILYWVLFYFIVRYSFLKGEIPLSRFVISAVLGTLVTVVMIGSFFVFRKRFGGQGVHLTARGS